jgi:1-acyl-sn-glycerol-3-phosphate acyltransferase
MHTLLACFRLLLGLPLLLLACLMMAAVGWVTLTIKGYNLAQWLSTLFTRVLVPIFNLRIRCDNPQVFRGHTGFVFANHSSYADVFVMIHQLPFRFLAAAEYLAWPFIGWAGKAAGTFPVDRSSIRSRAEAIIKLGKLTHFPAISLFPEGVIGPLGELQPFYPAVFKICAENRIPYVLCAIVYDDLATMGWGNETIVPAVWRLLCAPKRQHVTLRVLRTLCPSPEDNPRQLATEAHREVAAALGYEPKM